MDKRHRPLATCRHQAWLIVPEYGLTRHYSLQMTEDPARFEAVKAQKKQLVWFEHSAHIPMTEEPGKFLLCSSERFSTR